MGDAADGLELGDGAPSERGDRFFFEGRRASVELALEITAHVVVVRAIPP